MIHVFHGFLGSPSDFAFLRDFGEVRLHDIYEEHFDFEIQLEDTLIGYSMGGRIALELAHQNHYKMKKLVLINAHPGLPEPMTERRIWEDSVVERLATLSSEEFLTYWNKLPLFRGDKPLKNIDEERFKKSLALFDKHRLSKQTCYLPDLAKYHDKVLSLSGLQDEKYAQIARDLIAPCGVKCLFLDGGHRLFQNPELIIKTLQSEHIL